MLLTGLLRAGVGGERRALRVTRFERASQLAAQFVTIPSSGRPIISHNAAATAV